MEIQELKELALIFKETANSKTKTTLDIFYNVENSTELLCADTYLKFTPSYTTRTEPALSFRGSIEKFEVNKLRVGLRNVSSKDIGVHAKWTFSVYNRNTEEYQLISKSRMKISSFKEFSKFYLQRSHLRQLIHENTLLFKWHIETLPSPPGQVRSPVVISEALDKLLETLPVDKHNESEKEKTLLSIMEDLGKCKNRQINSEEMLQTIEQNVLDINDRLTTMLSNTYVTRESFLEERGRQTYHSPQTTDQNELRNEMKMTLEEKRETRPKRNSAQYEAKTRQKQSFDKETQTERDFFKVFEPKYTERLLSRSPVSPNLSEKSTDLPMFLKNRRQEKKDLVCKRYPQRLESKFQHESLIPSHRRFGFMGSYSPRVDEEVYYSAEESLKSPEMTYELECMSSSDIPTGKRILFLGSDLDLMRAILYHQYKNSAFWRMSEKKELQLVECKNEGIYFYCGCFSGSHPVSDVRRLMMNSEKYTSHGFHGCVLFIRTALDKNILHIFDAKFLRQFCILLTSTDLDFIGFDDKNIVRFDWFSFGPEILKNKLKLVSTEQFLFDKLIMKMAFDIMPPEPKALKEMNELKEKCLSLRDFIHTIIYKYKVGHEMLPLTQEIRLLLQECLDILEDHNKLTKK